MSGPVIFELSRAAAQGGLLLLDLLPDVPAGELTQLLQARQAALPQLALEDLLTGMLHNRLGRTVLRRCGLSLEAPCGSLPADRLTAGGIRTDEFSAQTLESRLCPGLYAAGEVLDIDGDCGGYNLQWAWSSGRLAGQLLTGRERHASHS